MVLRILRAAVVAIVVPVLFAASQRATLARGDEPLPGISVALAVLSAIFLVSAVVSERLRGPEANLQNDVLWGFGIGSIITILSRC
jgi:hypothetical protein